MVQLADLADERENTRRLRLEGAPRIMSPDAPRKPKTEEPRAEVRCSGCRLTSRHGQPGNLDKLLCRQATILWHAGNVLVTGQRMLFPAASLSARGLPQHRSCFLS